LDQAPGEGLVSDVIVQTTSGAVEGARLPGLRRWLGIPYARAPRFAAPVPVESWPGVRPATAFGKQCAQQMGGKVQAAQLDNADYGEDCLHLNVWTPEGGAPGPKPVMVWIHGGAFMAGSANPYDASGYSHLAELGGADFAHSGNAGMLDIIAALEWVRDNIAAFGGDPARVTICGQSAGSMSVSLLMLAPSACGLFHGAIMQSGAVSLIHDRERSIQDARRYAELLDLDQGGLERLRTMELVKLFEAQVQVGKELKNGIPAAPWFDGDLIPASLEEAHGHDAAPVPLLAGATRDEIVLFDLMPGAILPSKWADLEALLFAQLPRDHAERVLAAYPRTRKGRIALASDLTFLMPTRNFAERHARHQPTWFYRFDYSHPIAGATHGLDLTLSWPFAGFKMALVRGGPASGRRKALGERMRSHVAQFVRTGALGADWPAYTPQTRKVQVYNLRDELADNPEAERFTAWAGRDVSPGVARG